MELSLSLQMIKDHSAVILRTDHSKAVHHEDMETIFENLVILRSCITLLQTKQKEMRVHTPRFLLRRWAYASLNASLLEIKRAEKCLRTKKPTSFFAHARLAALWSYQACSIIEVRSFIRQIENNLAHYKITPHHIQKGDVILSYKTEAFLKRERLSRIIALSTNSPITHSLIATTSTHPHTFLSANPESKGLGLKNETPRDGELYLVFRLREELSSVSKETLLNTVDKWVAMANHTSWKHLSFGELKSWAACAIGYIYVITSYLFLRPVCLANPVHESKTIFCSEVVDTIFREAGIYLTPRSGNHSVVGPAELFYSPLLSFQGVIVNQEDLREFKKEIAEKFTLSLFAEEK